MNLHVLATGSKGNCYLLRGEAETLILEAGVQLKEVKKALGFDLGSIQGCLVTHEHQDHAKYVHEFVQAGIDVYASAGTHSVSQCSTIYTHRNHILDYKPFVIGAFSVLPFAVVHDAIEPLGFLIRYEEKGELNDILFVTDTHYIPCTFKSLNNIIAECNYSLDIVNAHLAAGGNQSLRNRVLHTHMELESFKGFLASNDLSAVNNIVMIHLSDANSNARAFKHAIQEAAPLKNIVIAEKGMIINLDKQPF